MTCTLLFFGPTFARVAAEIESAIAASVQRCYECRHPDHLVKDCPHSEPIDHLAAHRVNVSAGNRDGCRKSNIEPVTYVLLM